MMSTFITMLITVLVCFFIARRNKSPRAFVNLMICLCMSIIVGATVKSIVSKKETISTVVNQSVVADTTMCPTLHNFLSAVVWTDEKEENVMGKETNTERDSVSVETERIPTRSVNQEAIDDS